MRKFLGLPSIALAKEGAKDGAKQGLAPRRSFSGFTLIELVIVVAITALIVGSTTVALGNISGRRRDIKRVNDIKAVHEALEMFREHEKRYPTTAEFVVGSPLTGPTSGRTYLKKIPTNPFPRTDGGCADSEYSYSQLIGGRSYALYYCLGNKVGVAESGINQANPSTLAYRCTPNCVGKCGGGADGCGGVCNNACEWTQLGGYIMDVAGDNPNYLGSMVYDIGIDSAGTIYVAYHQGGPTDPHSTHIKKYDSGSWVDIDPDGIAETDCIPGVLSFDGTTLYFMCTDSSNSYVYKYQDSALVKLGEASKTFWAYDPDFKVINGVPYAVFGGYNWHPSDSWWIYVSYWDGDSFEYYAGGNYVSQNATAGYGDLRIDSYNNEVYVGYRDRTCAGALDPTVKKWNGAAWVEVGSACFASGGDSAEPLDMVIDQTNGDIYTVFKDNDNSGYMTAYKYTQGGSWQILGSAGFTGVATNKARIALDGSTPYVAFSDGVAYPDDFSPKVKKFNGSSWVDVGTQPIVADVYSPNNYIAIYNHVPYVGLLYSYQFEVARVGAAYYPSSE